MTSVMQLAITASALCIAAAAAFFAVSTARQERNAALVQIGVAILRADPAKEGQVSAAREWALDLIDANAGGVKFTKDARTQLLNRQLEWVPTPTPATGGTGWGGGTNGGDDLSGNPKAPVEPPQRRQNPSKRRRN
jgi:hypothetical protein